MKWKFMKPRQRDEEQKEEKQATTKKPSNSSNSSPSSSSSSTFSISQLLPLSWLVSRLKSKSKRSATTLSRPAAKPCYSRPSPPPSPRPPKEPHPNRRPKSPYLAFRHFAGDPRRIPARFPPPVTAPDVPHRRSLGDDGASRPSGIEHARADRRQWRKHHHSMGDLELTLGHLIPFSVLSRAVESDSGSDGSADTDARNGQLLRGTQRQRRRRRIGKAVQPFEADSGDVVLQRMSFGKRMRRPRARAKVRVSSPRNPTSALPATTARRRRKRAEEDVTKARELERFAVVTRSRDPHRDFRESMVEMIWEKGIGRPEELEDLLACYLSLNAEEHHDVIVKVFRQVWFELHPERFARSN